MKKILGSLVVAFTFFLFTTYGAFSHHMAEGMVDEEVYAMIDDLVADTPHTAVDFYEIPEDGMTVTAITTEAIKFLEDMIDEGLMDFIPMLDGNITVTIEYDADTRSAFMSITQLEEVE